METVYWCSDIEDIMSICMSLIDITLSVRRFQKSTQQKPHTLHYKIHATAHWQTNQTAGAA